MYPSSFAITSQIGIEATPGTVVDANRILHALHFQSHLRRDTEQSRSRNRKYQDSSVGKRVWADGSYEGILCYNAITYVLAGLFASPSAQQIGSTAAYLRTFLASNGSDAARKTYTFQVGSSEGVDRYPYGQLASLQCNLGQDEAKVSGEFFAQQPAFNQTQTATATKVLARPVTRRHIDVYLDTTWDALGSTKVSDAFQETISIGSKWKAVWEHNNGGSKTFRRAAEQPSVITFAFLTPHNSQSRAYCDSLLDGAMRYLRIVCTGAQIALLDTSSAGFGSLGSVPLGGLLSSIGSSLPIYEQIIFDLPCKIDVAEEEDEQDAYARRYAFHSLYDSNLGGSFRVQVTNGLATL